MGIDVFQIAQNLVNELAVKQESDKLRAEGVVMLFDRLKEAAQKADATQAAEAPVLDVVADVK